MAPRSLNKVLLLGNLGRDPEVRYTSSGKAVANFTLATSQTWKDEDGNDQTRTEWHRVVAWGRLGEICGEYLNKGSQVFVEGRIQSREWEDQDGNRRTTVEIIAGDLIMLGGRGGQSGGQSGPPDEGDRKPEGGRQRFSKSGPQKSRPPEYRPPEPEDEIPF
jgi:single-strand DNA-binding protein